MCHSPRLNKKVGDRLKDGSLVTENMYGGCGKCVECKLKRINDWVFRLQKEKNDSKTSYFITLTYDTQSVPITKNNMLTLVKKELQQYMYTLKALNPKLKYYACGEYGTHTNRPHYHAIVFNVMFISDIHRCWINNETEKPKGSVDIGTVTQESIAYCAKYTDKETKIPEHKNDFREKEFSIMSHKIGLGYLSKKGVTEHHQADILKNSTYVNNGIKRPLPRYYRDKLYTKEQQIEMNLDFQMQMDNDYKKRENEYYQKHPNGNFESYEQGRKEAAVNKYKAKQKNRTSV